MITIETRESRQQLFEGFRMWLSDLDVRMKFSWERSQEIVRDLEVKDNVWTFKIGNDFPSEVSFRHATFSENVVAEGTKVIAEIKRKDSDSNEYASEIMILKVNELVILKNNKVDHLVLFGEGGSCDIAPNGNLTVLI